MKITKGQLRRIIKEQVGQDTVGAPSASLDELMLDWEAQQHELFDEAVEGHSTEEEWNAQVQSASGDLRTRIEMLLTSVEEQLHNGEYHMSY